MQPVVTSPPSKKKGKYDITFKLKVIQWAEKHSNRAAGSKFGLNESTIRGWRKSAVANSLEALSEISRGVLSLHQSSHGGQGLSKQVLNQDSIKSNRTRPVGSESPPQTLALDERDLARLSCSPSDDGYYDDVCYQEEVVDSPSPSPTPLQQTLASQTPPIVLKTISHQITSKPFPEIQLPFTVIVCKSVRDHWLQRYASENAVHERKREENPELDVFARTLGLERR